MTEVALVTGCSRGGIGDALAQEFYQKGVRVFASARDLSKIQHLKVMGLDTVQLDVTSEESIQNAVRYIEMESGGKLDYLVNNAGMGYLTPLLDADIALAKRLFDTNFWSVLAMVKAFSPTIIAAKGKIINIGAITGVMTQPYWAHVILGINCSCKAALHMLGDTLRVELAPFDVQVVTVIAGTINTTFFENQAKLIFHTDSLYQSVQSHINYSASAEEWRPWTEPSDFAAGVVANALKKNPKVWYWRGTKTFITWLAVTFLPYGFLVRIQL
ncbi:hypothetical protein BGZ57DRAFT_810926 [Hyaloscypha finlandica]|nr:hypothetical protein BGZ57DRAFT_810926 [Hyaloscypha finlandica]